MDFSLGCQNRCRQQDGFQSMVPKSAQTTRWIRNKNKDGKTEQRKESTGRQAKREKIKLHIKRTVGQVRTISTRNESVG